MARYICQYGHIDSKGRPVVHPSKAMCELRTAHKDQRENGTPVPAGPVTPAPPQSKPTSQSSVAAVAKEVVATNSVQVTDVPATALPSQAQAEQVNADYLLTKEDTILFAGTCWSLVGMVVNGACGFCGIPDTPQTWWELNIQQKFLIETSFRPSISAVIRKLGNKTPEQGHLFVAGFVGLVAFGGVFLNVFRHFWKELPKSEKWQARRKAKGEKLAAKRAALAEKLAAKQGGNHGAPQVPAPA